MSTKTILASLALAAAAVFLLVFLIGLLRELLLELRVHRSKRTHLLTEPHVRPEWEIKDPPAWERYDSETKPGRPRRVRLQLRGLGQ